MKDGCVGLGLNTFSPGCCNTVSLNSWVSISNESYVFTGRLNEVVAGLEEFFAQNEPLPDAFATIGLMKAYLAAEDVDQATVYLERAERAAT